jgi:hypothetical protein
VARIGSAAKPGTVEKSSETKVFFLGLGSLYGPRSRAAYSTLPTPKAQLEIQIFPKKIHTLSPLVSRLTDPLSSHHSQPSNLTFNLLSVLVNKNNSRASNLSAKIKTGFVQTSVTDSVLKRLEVCQIVGDFYFHNPRVVKLKNWRK